MTIANIDFRRKAAVTGEFRVRRPEQHFNTKGVPFLEFTLEDRTGELPAIAWNKSIDCVEELADLACINLTGRLRVMEGIWLVDVSEAQIFQQEPEHPAQLIPYSAAPELYMLEALDEMYNYISHPALRKFVGWVLADLSITLPFITLPASRQHHHSTDGGLLDHSLECASIVSGFGNFPVMELELAVVGALYHDVGKIRTLKCVGKHTTAGHILDHDALTLEILAPHLQQLDSICPDAGLALRYIWTWRNQKSNRRHPLLTIVEIITAADRVSSGNDRQKTAFGERPDWHSYARIDDNSAFWRPKLELIKG